MEYTKEIGMMAFVSIILGFILKSCFSFNLTENSTWPGKLKNSLNLAKKFIYKGKCQFVTLTYVSGHEGAKVCSRA